ncbi:inverse autotransporter beta domain-containing protein [Candidatus Sodalis endolongispinus]|uniref:Inverse autotransporter beta domain-containing protein n=1 Tax=Candidatus Sodalis endolongispinus TaxID=2812662 RepID=A0ABS5YEC0_9GAMM|nr:inverse autotransporter beta domain-containing protein [Candidatus Sodalis endolongispinus]
MRKVMGYISALSLVTSLVSYNKWSRNKEAEAAPNLNQPHHTASTESGRRKNARSPSLNQQMHSSEMPMLFEENNASDKQAAGETRVHLPLSESQISSGSLDLLYPLYEDDRRIVFNQLGLRRSENRNILNLGLGQRHYGAGWLAGYNAFYDAQLSDSPHQRLGLGVEYRRDSLHLAVNGYYGLTGWRAADAMSGRDERVSMATTFVRNAGSPQCRNLAENSNLKTILERASLSASMLLTAAILMP